MSLQITQNSHKIPRSMTRQIPVNRSVQRWHGSALLCFWAREARWHHPQPRRQSRSTNPTTIFSRLNELDDSYLDPGKQRIHVFLNSWLNRIDLVKVVCFLLINKASLNAVELIIFNVILSSPLYFYICCQYRRRLFFI